MTTTEQAPYAAALTGLPGMGPATLVTVLSRWAPKEAWDRIVTGSLVRPRRTGRPADRPDGAGAGGDEPDAGREWAVAASRFDPPAWWARMSSRAIRVTWWGQDSYPAALRGDPQPPGVLFWQGSLDVLDRPCVAIVGTRRASPDGRAVAFELGRDLAAAGICIVSGLALGIDGAAHTGALEGWAGGEDGGVLGSLGGTGGTAPPVGVAASGVDVPYPRRHAALWHRVAEAGAMLSETLPGRRAEGWRFPARNRIIAGLVRMVVVVESHTRGGSLITADAAIARGVDVRVVPGPVHSPASAGTNQLLYEGPGPVRDARDVLDGLGIFLAHGTPDRGTGYRGDGGRRRGPTAGPPAAPLPDGARLVVEAVGWRPASLNQIVARSGLPVARIMALLDQLEAAGMLSREGDWWARVQ